MRRGERPVGGAWRALVEALMAAAARDYAAAREAIPYLPAGFRRSVAVAAAVYEGIHGAIRRNGHDNLRRRAVTTTGRKLVLAAGALCGGGQRRGWLPAVTLP
jgi:phytoene synthase